MSGQAPKTDYMQTAVGPATALVDTQSVVGESTVDGVVTNVSYTPIAAVTGAASPASRTLTLYNRGQTGVGTTVVAQLALVGGVNLVQYDEKAITLSGTAANLNVAVGDILEWESLHIGGTGLADPGGQVRVEISRS